MVRATCYLTTQCQGGRYSEWADEPLSFTMGISTDKWLDYRTPEVQRVIGRGGAPMRVHFGRDGAYVLDVIYCSATDEIYVDFLEHGLIMLKRSSCTPRGHSVLV